MRNEIENKLFSFQDISYRDFHAKLMPTVSKENIIGVRVPLLRKYAKQISDTELAENFMKALPHSYYEENNLHAFLIALIKDYDICMQELEAFLPYIDNWATCDGISPKALKKEPERLLLKIKEWLKSDRTYTVRFGIKCLMDFYLDESFSEEILKLVADIKSDEYYINMCSAWFFATAVAKQPESTIPYLTENRLSVWVHNKTIQKAIESYRISDDVKMKLRALRR
ncbi:MAG: DNA alkylation repair protein [Clostridia bacterium]|nr:DNA alkylation repair protein [Clostridia bacterium]